MFIPGFKPATSDERCGGDKRYKRKAIDGQSTRTIFYS